MSSQQTELGFNVLCFCSFCESPTQHFHLCLTLPVYWASMSLSSRLHGRRSRPWRPVWRTSFLGRAKWSTWFAPWSRRDQLTRRPSNAYVRAFPPTPWQMWRWPRSRQELTGKPKLQPRSPDGKSGSLLWLVDCTGHRLRRQTEVNKWTLIILGEEKPRSSAVVVLWEKNGSKLEMCGLFVVNTHLWLSADKRVVGGWMQTVPSLLCLYLCHCWCWGEMHSILPCWDFPQEITGRFFLVLFFFFWRTQRRNVSADLFEHCLQLFTISVSTKAGNRRCLMAKIQQQKKHLLNLRFNLSPLPSCVILDTRPNHAAFVAFKFPFIMKVLPQAYHVALFPFYSLEVFLWM